jgi:hypothetical protein
MNKNTFFLALITLLGVMSCYKTPTYPKEPHIEFESYTVAQPYTITDTGNLRIRFTDGDGDLGMLNNTDSATLSKIYIYNIKYGLASVPRNIPIIPKKGTTDAISGTIDIKLAGTGGVGLLDESACLLIQQPIDTLTFSIYIQDRAGNKSNVITTPPLLVKCP